MSELGHHAKIVADGDVLSVQPLAVTEHVKLAHGEGAACGREDDGFGAGGNTTKGPVWRPRIHTWAMVRSVSAVSSMISKESSLKASRSQALVARNPGTPGRAHAGGSSAAMWLILVPWMHRAARASSPVASAVKCCPARADAASVVRLIV